MNGTKIQITVRRKARKDGEEPKYDASYELPMDDADAGDAETFAAMAMKGLNAQLDYSKSKYRLVVYDTEERQMVKLVEK